MESLLPMIETLALGVAGFALLQGAYTGFKLQLPNSYANLSETHTLKVYSRMWRITAFRVLPVFVVMTLIWALAFRSGASGWVAVLIATTLHIALSNGRGFIDSVKSQRVNYGSYHLIAIGMATGGAVAASFLGPHTQHFVPSFDTLIESLWTALFVAVLVGVLLYITKNDNESDPNSTEYLITRATSDVGVQMYDRLFAEASNYNADPIFAKAIMTSEVLQRPRWIRSAEQIFGRIYGKGTYGVMQMESNKPIDDLASIKKFVQHHANMYPLSVDVSGYASCDENTVWQMGSDHQGGDIAFLRPLVELYSSLFAEIKWSSPETIANGEAAGIIEKRRYPHHWGIRVLTNAETLNIYEDDINHYSNITTYSRPADVDPGGWYSFEHKCSIRVKEIWIHGLGPKLPGWPEELSVSS